MFNTIPLSSMKRIESKNNIGLMVEQAAARYGDKTAYIIDHEGITFNFNDLNNRSNQIANAMAYAGIKSGDHVAVMLPNCSEFPIVWLALAKLGAVMVPINIRYQAFDLEYVLRDSDAVALVVHTSLIHIFEKIPAGSHQVKQLFRIGPDDVGVGVPLSELAHDMSVQHKSADPDPDDLMNIQYTSGTTGFAKGVMTTHEYWLGCGELAASTYIDKADTFLSMSPFYYMDPQWELIMSLLTGASIVMCKKITAENFARCIESYPVTVCWGSEDLLYMPRHDEYKNYNLKRVLLSAFTPNLHKVFEEHFNVVAREVYGMTEIGAGTVMAEKDTHMVGSGSVGKPVGNRELRIVDRNGNDVTQGEVGELLVKGPGILKGYYNKPEATEKAFYEGFFRTGDLFKQDQDGYYYFVGRLKDMIRRMGDNISAEEVENVLTSHPKIQEAAVLGVPDKIRDEEVKAYIIPAPGETPETIPPQEIVEFCLERIAKFKVPRFIEYRSDFPLSASDKIRKHKLLEEKEDPTIDCFDRFAK